MSRNINRITAETDLRMMNVFAAAQSSEGYGKAAEKLSKEAGDAVTSEPKEPVGMEQLAGLMKSMKAGRR